MCMYALIPIPWLLAFDRQFHTLYFTQYGPDVSDMPYFSAVRSD